MRSAKMDAAANSLRLGLAMCIYSSISFAQAEELSYQIGGIDPVQVGVKTPSGRLIYLYDTEYKCAGTWLSDGYVHIDTERASAIYWQDGKRRYVHAFDRLGLYEVYISDNLETELDNSDTTIYRYQRKQRNKNAKPAECKDDTPSGVG